MVKPNPVDRYFAAKCVKKEVDAAFKEAETEAQIFLDEARDKGQTSLISTYFGEEAGEYKRGRTRAKHVVEFNYADAVLFNDWLNGNQQAERAYLCEFAKEFGQWWFEKTGELPEGISRVEYDEPPALKAPQIYRYDHELVKSKLAQGGNFLEGANRMLLGDGE